MHGDNYIRLFHGFNKREEIEKEAETEIRRIFTGTSAKELLETSEEEFVETAMRDVDINIPGIDFEDWEARTTGEGGNRKIEIPLSYTGDSELLEIEPSEYEPQENFQPKITRNQLTFSFNLSNLESGNVNEDLESKLTEVEEGLERLQQDLENLKQDLRGKIRQKYRRRKKQAQENEEKLNELDIPIEDRDE